MAYTINLSNGDVLTAIADGTVDTVTTNLKLVGKNYTGYGEILNENSIWMLENFANSFPPTEPIVGQLWWNTDLGQLHIYDGAQFKVVSSSAASGTEPVGAVEGDLWWNSSNNQLHVHNSIDWTLIGPAFSSGAGTTGAIVEVIKDTSLVDHVVVMTFVSNIIVSITSKDAYFLPNNLIPGFAGGIKPGINLVDNSIIPDVKYHGISEEAESLGGITASRLVLNDVNGSIDGTLDITNDVGVKIGVGHDLQLSVSNDEDARIFNRSWGADLTIGTTSASGAERIAMSIDGGTGIIDLNGATVTNLSDPSNPLDAVNKQYVASLISGSILTATETISLIKTIPAAGSGLDADLLDGQQGSYYATASNVYTKAEVDAQHDSLITGIDWKEAVSTQADLSIIYDSSTTEKTPVEGWTVNVNSDDTVYRYDGSTWVLFANGVVPLASASDPGKMTSADFIKLGTIETNATGDMSSGEIKTAYEANAQTNAFTDSEKSKLASVAFGADVSTIPAPNDLLASLLTVDGPGSGLDADLLDGQSGSYYTDFNNLSNRVTGVEDIVGGMVTGNTESGISVVYQPGDGTLDFNVNDPVITLTGDVTGSATMTNLGNTTINTTVANNSHSHLWANITDKPSTFTPTTESVEDIVGGMVTGNTESGISVVYQDGDGTLDFNVNDPTLTFTGGATGSGTMTNLSNTTIALTVPPTGHVHNTFDRSTTDLANAAVFDRITVSNGIVTDVNTRTLTPADIGAATSSHTHAYNSIIGTDTDLNTSGAQVIDQIIMTDGVITSPITTRNLIAADIGAATSSHSHGTFDRSSADLSGATVFDRIAVTNGIVTDVATRELTPADLGLNTTASSTQGEFEFGNIKFKWGKVTNTTDTDQTVTFGTPFPSLCANVQITMQKPGANSSSEAGLGTITASNFIFNRADTVDGTAYCFWFAIGW